MSKFNSQNCNKTISVKSNGMIINYIDSNKHQFIKYESKDLPRFTPSKYQEFEKSVFNQKQEKMFLEAMYGLNIYPENMVNKMPKNVVFKIITRYRQVHKALNKWKQEMVNSNMDNLLVKMFPNSPVVKQMLGIESDDTIRCNISLKDLGINEYKIAIKLVSLSLLPNNFFELA